MAYTTINKSNLHFNTKLYTGNGTDNHAITGVGFQPDFVWIKTRSTTGFHRLQDAVRGTTKEIYSNSDAGESTDTNTLKSFDSDGFTLGTTADYNGNGRTQASWNWKANGAGSSNSDGSVTSTVSANTTAGFSIVKWTGTGATATIGHGLGAKPSVVLIKNTGASENWVMYHSSLGATHNVKLNNTEAQQDTTGAFNDTEPTSSVFTVHTNTNVNQSGQVMIAYVFTEKTGYSKFGSYTGNGNADGTFVYTGFKPAFVMIKRTDSTNSWGLFDNKRNSSNPVNKLLVANASSVEDANNTRIDMYSNGFKPRINDPLENASGGSYIYMAFAEAPLVGTNDIPCTAR